MLTEIIVSFFLQGSSIKITILFSQEVQNEHHINLKSNKLNILRHLLNLIITVKVHCTGYHFPSAHIHWLSFSVSAQSLVFIFRQCTVTCYHFLSAHSHWLLFTISEQLLVIIYRQ